VEAKEELDALSKLDMPRGTLDFYREQWTEARAQVQAEEQSAVFERRYRQAVTDRNWFAARDVALELGKAQPASQRVEAMYAEVERLEASAAASRPWSRASAKWRPSSSRATPARPSWPSGSSSRWTRRTGTASTWRSE
jgi:hypothetical protein